MSSRSYSIPWRPFNSLVALAVLPYQLADFVAEARTPYWTGLHLSEWFATLGPLLVYLCFSLIVALVIHAALATSPESARNKEGIPADRLTMYHLFAVLGASTILYYGLRRGLEVGAYPELDIAHRVSLTVVAITWVLQRFNFFAFAPALMGAAGTVVGGALLLQHYASTLVVRTFGIHFAAYLTLRHAAIMAGLAVVAGVIGSRRPAWRMRAGVAVCLIAVGYPVYKQVNADRLAAQRPISGPNILMITADTMRADYLSVYGGRVETPVLEAFAEKGAKFEQAISLAPWTIPSFNGMFSSKFPPSVDPNLPESVRDEQMTLYGQIGTYWRGADDKSLPGRLRDRGYHASAIIGNFAMRRERWLLDDFNTVRVIIPLLETWHGPFARSPFLSTTLRSLGPSLYVAHPFDTTRAVTEYTQSTLRYLSAERFFFWAHFFDPHTPYDPPAEYRSRTGPYEFLGFDGPSDGFEDKDYVRTLYSGEIRYVDDGVGSILETLDDTGLGENTYVVFASDHGEEFWDHGSFGHGHSVYDELLHVPLIITGPGIPAQSVSRPVSMIDFLPTLAEWAGLSADPEWRGSSLASSLRNANFPQSSEPIFSQGTGRLPPPPEPLQSVIVGNNKLIYGMETGGIQLFNRHKDPAETIDVAKTRRKMVERLRGRLDDWSESFPVTFGAFLKQGTTLETDHEMLENLKVLGYLPDDTP